MQQIKLTSPIPPSVNHYTSHRVVTKNGKPLGIVYKTKEAKTYQSSFKKYVEEEVKSQEWITDIDCNRHFYVDADFYMDKKHRDCNNTWKCMLDAITETQLIWKDDDIVCERVNKIVYDAENPRVELRIYYVDYIGIFDNEEQLTSFKEKNCVDCKRYKRNCALLKNAIEGRIQKEICDNVCEKKSTLEQRTEQGD